MARDMLHVVGENGTILAARLASRGQTTVRDAARGSRPETSDVMTRMRPPARSTLVLAALAVACSASEDGSPPVGGSAGIDGGTSSDTGVAPDGATAPECPSSCDDGNPCTDDSCSAAGTCEHVANTRHCDDGNPCTEGDACSEGVCRSGPNVCPCAQDVDCVPHDDGNLCNGTLACGSSHECVVDPSTVVTCPTSQDSACAKNQCDPQTGTCSLKASPDGTACDDGDNCTGTGACQSGSCVGASELCCQDGADNDGDQQTDCDDPDCAGTPSCEGTCPALEAVDPSPLPVQSPSNAVASTTVNGFDDDYVFNQSGDRKLGVRRNWGGSIVFFGIHDGSPGMNGTNTIDANDTGREVQVALYDHERWYQGCAWNASCNTTPTSCPHTMTYFGWNPVQGGNRCNHGSGYEDILLEDGAITLTTQPLYWNPNWDRTDCQESCHDPSTDTRRSDVELTQRVRFVRKDVVELTYRVVNLGGLDHKVAPHEFPTVYASFGKNGTPDLYRLFDSTSTEITTGWNVDAHGFRHQNFTSPGGWAALLNHNLDYGIALYYEGGMSTFQAWNKADDPKFNNFRGLFSFPIGPYAEVRARSYLILGSLAGVGAQAQWLSDHLPPFGWLDSPLPDADVSGNVSVHGWAMDNKSVAAVQMIIDGGAPISLSYGKSRPDVCKVWPGYPACSHGNVGFEGSFDASALGSQPCGHVVEIKAVDDQGNEKIIARQRFYPTS